MNHYTHIDAGLIADVSAMLRDMLGDEYDDQTFLDTLDGETDVMDAIGSLITHRQEAEELSKAMKAVAETYTTRARRFAAGKEACTAALEKILDAMQQQKVPHPLGTVSRTKPRAKVEIVAADEIPTQLRKWSVDASAVKKQLEAGEDVPGARLVYGQPGLTVRVK